MRSNAPKPCIIMPLSDYIPPDKSLWSIERKLSECLRQLPQAKRLQDPELRALRKLVLQALAAATKIQMRRRLSELRRLGQENQN